MKKLQQPHVIIPILDIIPIDEKEVRKYLGKIKLKKITIIFFGSDSFVIPILQALEQNFEVSLVVTAQDSAIQMEAKKLGIPTQTPDKLDESFLDVLSNTPPRSDLFVVASYGQILPQTLLDLPKFGSLNIHPSLLPKYRGPSPVPATILNGDKVTGVTIIKMDQQMDHGPIIATKKISLTGQETFPELINKLFQLGADFLVQVIPDYVTDRIKPVEQNHAKALFCQLITKRDGYFDINHPPSPEKLDRMIRAYHPWPGVWTKWKGKIVKFLPNVTLSETKGIYSSASPQNDKYLLQMEGKKAIPFKDFLNGYPDFPIKSF